MAAWALRAPAQDNAGAESRRLADLANLEIGESSGLAAGRRTPGVLWTLNDSNNRAELFAFDASGRDLGTFAVEGADNIDWEDMAAAVISNEPVLFVADVGDNDKLRPRCLIHVIPEPAVDLSMPAGGTAVVARTVSFTYEDGPRNCEALAWDPAREVFLLISKGGKTRAYELDPGDGTARRIADLPLRRVTACDISPDGLRLAVLTYDGLNEYSRQPDETWPEALRRIPFFVPLDELLKAEAVGYGANGTGLYVTSEGSPAPLWTVHTPHRPPEPGTAPKNVD